MINKDVYNKAREQCIKSMEFLDAELASKEASGEDIPDEIDVLYTHIEDLGEVLASLLEESAKVITTTN